MRSANRWGRARRWVIAGFIVGWLTLQLAVPTIALVARGAGVDPVRFGWQMYSAHGPAREYVFVGKNGREAPVPVSAVVYRVRADTDLHPALTDWYCERRPNISAVVMRRAGRTDVVLRCPK